MRRGFSALLVALAAAVAPAPAQAAASELAIADDRILLYGGPPAVRAVERWSALGVDSVRILAYWPRIAPEALGRRRPGYLRPTDPFSRGYNWSQIDTAVSLVRGAGMKPMLTLTGPGPVWSSSDPSRRNGRHRPKPSEYAAFVTAAARRYKGRVARYILWNEPNLNTWLSPQLSCRRGVCRNVSAHVYRRLVRAAVPAIRRVDPDAEVLIGTMSSRGMVPRSSRSTTRPLAFVRALGCVGPRFQRDRSSACRSFAPARADGFAFHPHGVLTAPDQPFNHPDDINLASIRRLGSALDRLQRKRRLIPSTRRWNLYLDEYGYQTNPPDRFAGVSPGTQDRWLQRAAYQAWRDPRVRLFSNYLWQDEPVVRGATYGGWQSGLLFRNGRGKPALAHFRMPFVVDAARWRLWGQVRPGAAHTVTVQRRLPGRGWTRLATRRTDSRGFWTLRTRVRSGAAYRFRDASGARSATVTL